MMMKIATICVIICIAGAVQAMPGPSNEHDDHHQDHDRSYDVGGVFAQTKLKLTTKAKFCSKNGNTCLQDAQCCSRSCTGENTEGKKVCEEKPKSKPNTNKSNTVLSTNIDFP